jgi:hypothetical protein
MLGPIEQAEVYPEIDRLWKHMGTPGKPAGQRRPRLRRGTSIGSVLGPHPDLECGNLGLDRVPGPSIAGDNQ